MLSDGVLRGGRAVLLSSATLALALLAHAVGGGAPPRTAVLGLAFLLLLGLCLCVGNRRLGATRIAALLGGGQLALHLAFGTSTGGGHAAMPMPATMPAHASHQLHHASPEGQNWAGQHGVSMLLAHVVATLLLGLLLARIEQIVWHLAVALGVAVVGDPAVAVPGARRPATGPRRRFADHRPELTGITRRGPPGRPVLS